MNKSQIVDILYKRLKKYKKSEIKEVVDRVFETMTSGLKEDKRIEIRGLGSFVLKEIPSKTARNPKNGELVKVPPKKTVYFKMGKILKKELFNKKS